MNSTTLKKVDTNETELKEENFESTIELVLTEDGTNKIAEVEGSVVILTPSSAGGKNSSIQKRKSVVEVNDVPVGYTEPPDENWRFFRDIIFITVAYGSNLGGTGTLTGTNPNLVLKGFLERSFF